MPETMYEVLAKRLTVKILAMSVDEVVCNLVKRIRCTALESGFAGLKRLCSGALCAQNDVVNLPLARGEFARDGQSTRDVGGVHRVFTRGINHYDVAGLHRAGVVRIMQNRRIVAGPDDRGIRRAFATPLSPLILQQCG